MEKQTIDLILPTVRVELINKEFLKEQGIGNIKLIKIENDQIIQEEVSLFEYGKELRLINPFPLDQKEFYTLLSHTNPLVACTGDHSLSEAISFDRLPFYELRDMKLAFQTNLIALAERVGKAPFYLKQYFKELFKIYDRNQERMIDLLKKYDDLFEMEKAYYNRDFNDLKGKQFKLIKSSLIIANLLQQPELTDEFHALNQLIKSQYSFNETLICLVEQQLAFSSCPDLKNFEQQTQEKYLTNQITLIQSVELLTEKIKKVTTATL
ncbi:MAG: hypothetical protein H0T62_01855 [Parachlamydiaceae bacterium]|nr:hypothetical protein [Parachlamydiaceae bacterium]